MEDGARAPARIENLYVVTPLKKTRYASGAYNRSAVNKSGDCPRARVGFFDGQVAGADRRRGRAVPHNYRFVFFLGRKAMPRCRRVMVIEAREPRSPLSPFPKGRSRRDAPRDGDRFRVWLQVLEKLRHRVFPPILLSPPSVPLYSFFFSLRVRKEIEECRKPPVGRFVRWMHVASAVHFPAGGRLLACAVSCTSRRRLSFKV